MDPISRRDFLSSAAVVGAATVASAEALAQTKPPATRTTGQVSAKSSGLLFPQQSQLRNVLDLSGLWQFQLDPREEGESKGWFSRLPAPRQIAVPCSWNDLFDDARDHLGLAWYLRELFVPSGWKGQRVLVRVGSANYAAKLWLNGVLVAHHLGGHLPFVADITDKVVWDSANVITISVENKQLPDRVPPGPADSGGGVAGLVGGYPATTYDFYPYAGLHRAVLLYSVPGEANIDDVSVVTTIEGRDGIVRVKVATNGDYSGKGRIQIGNTSSELTFQAGAGEATLRVKAARLWGPSDPHLYPLIVTLNDRDRVTDSYSLEIGIRTVAIRGTELMLNGQPIKLTGFGKHEDFPLHGRGMNLPMWIRDYELLKWVGANSYRTSHYPYAEEAMVLADRLGILVINEIPSVGLNFEDDESLSAKRLDQCLLQIRELISRDKNHPSTIMWNVANEPLAGPPLGKAPPVAAAVEVGKRFFKTLYEETRSLDPSRPVSLVGLQGGPLEWHGQFDVVAINRYYGWYTNPGQLKEGADALARELDELHKMFGKPILVLEFGCDTLPGAHATPPEMWSEEYQVEFLRGFLDVAAKRPFVAGMHVWAFADFKTGQATGRAAGMNFKGVFTRDRRPKMSAHFLRSRWFQERRK